MPYHDAPHGDLQSYFDLCAQTPLFRRIRAWYMLFQMTNRNLDSSAVTDGKAEAPDAVSPSAPRLSQSLGLFSSTALVIGSMIGSGIFIVDADIARGTNSPALFLGAWVVTAILTMIAALSYGELAAMMPKAGGQYVYLRESLGPLWGFLYGWTLFLVIQTGTIAAVCVAFGKFLGVFFPAISTTHWLWHIAHVPALRRGAHGAGQHGDRRQHGQPRRDRDRRLSGRREHLRRQAGRADPERLYHGQGAVAGGADPAGLHGGAQLPRPGRPTSARAGASSGRMPAGVRCIRFRWASAGRWCW